MLDGVSQLRSYCECYLFAVAAQVVSIAALAFPLELLSYLLLYMCMLLTSSFYSLPVLTLIVALTFHTHKLIHTQEASGIRMLFLNLRLLQISLVGKSLLEEPKQGKIPAYFIEGEETFMPQQPKMLRGLVSANIAVLFFGLAGVLGKLSSLPAPLIVFGRTFFASLVLLALCWFQHIPFRPKRTQDGFLLLGQGVLLALHWTTFFQAINVSNVAIGLLSFSSFPLFTAILEPLLLHQRPSRIQIVAALLILPGIFLLVPSFSLQHQTMLGVMWGVLSGASFALLSVTNRWL